MTSDIPSLIIWSAALYVFFGLVTFGHLMRTGLPGWQRKIRYFVGGCVWPYFWIVKGGPLYTILVLKDFLVRTNAVAAYSFLALMFPAYYLYSAWNRCSDSWDCGFTVVKAVLWGPFWPAYFAAKYMAGA